MSSSKLLTIAGEETSLTEGRLHLFHPDYINDIVLWNSFRKSEQRAFDIIFDRYVKLLYNYGMKIVPDSDLVKDSVQELFIELWRNHQNLGETDSIKLYLYKSIRRKLIRVKSKQAGSVFSKFPKEYIGETTPSIELNLMDEQTSLEKKKRVAELLNKLTKRQREAIFLRYFEDMEYEKIASVMELSKQVVYNLVNKAIASLRAATSIITGLLVIFQ